MNLITYSVGFSLFLEHGENTNGDLAGNATDADPKGDASDTAPFSFLYYCQHNFR